jgi:DnaJ-class molecular chaperone
MPYNEAADREDKPSVQNQSLSRRCKDCEGRGRVLSARNLGGLDCGRLEWEPCESCGGGGLEPFDPRGGFAPRARSYGEG